jgi:hypothetical protein
MINRLAGDEVGTVRMEPVKVQAIASALGQLLVGVSDLLVIVHSALGVPPETDWCADPGLGLAVTDPSVEEEGAESLESLLRGDLEVLVNETLPEAIAILGRVAQETEDTLRASWRERSGQGEREAR